MTPTELIAWLTGYEAGLAVTLHAKEAVTLHALREQNRKRVQRHRMKKKDVTLPRVYTSTSTLTKEVSKKDIRACNVTQESSEAFNRFWLAYPRHQDKKKSAERFHAAVRRGVDPEMIICSAAAYAAATREAKTEKQFIKLASGWILGERWADYPPQADAEIVQLTAERRAEILAKIRKQA